MNIKTLGLKLAGGLLAVAFTVTALGGHPGPASANDPICKPAPCAPADTRPDLVVSSFTTFTAPNGWRQYEGYVKNQGLSDAGPFKVKVVINGVTYGNISVPSLAAGASHWFGTPVPPYMIPPAGTKVTVHFQVVVDYDNQVDESKEGNNILDSVVGFS